MEKRPQKPPIRDTREDRPLPSDIGAERAILGAILLDNSSYVTAINLEAEDFILDSHRKIYLRMTDLMAVGKPVDFVTLTAELQNNHELENVGGINYVTSLTDGLPRVKNISQYVSQVKEKAKLRNLIHAANVVMESAYDPQGTVDEVLAVAGKQIAKLADTPEAIEAADTLFVDIVRFTHDAPKSINWLIEGVVQKGANGFIVARPKIGKSFLVVDMCIALAAGQMWIPGKQTISAGFMIEKPVKVALVSREDAPALTQWRMMKIAEGRQVHLEEIRNNLYVNSKKESHRLMIDNAADMSRLLRALERQKTEFLVLDVFRKLHDADENDNNEMARIVDSVSDIQNKVGCQICIVHHDNKREEATLTERIRGASAIAGWAEWVLGMKVVNPNESKHDWVREVEIEIKAALPPDNFFIRYIDSVPPATGVTVERVFWEPPKRKKKADSIAAGQQPIDYKQAQSERDDSEEKVPF